jgi:hypothetical protein
VAWIVQGTSPGLAITAAIPPVFESYATVVVPDGGTDRERYDRAVLALLAEQPGGQGLPAKHWGDQQWWLGYLNPPEVLAGAPTVALYVGWRYVLVAAGPRQAAAWGRDEDGWLWWRDNLPDLMFPADRSWLAATLADDDWTCVGGPAVLIDKFLAHRDLRARRVPLGVDATPPGHKAV